MDAVATAMLLDMAKEAEVEIIMVTTEAIQETDIDLVRYFINVTV